MPELNIHGRKVHIDGDSHSAKIAADFLLKHPDNAKSFFDAAHHDQSNGVSHFEIPRMSEHPDIGHHFTIHHHSDGSYSLRKRHDY